MRAGEHPNVLVFLIDDLGCRDLASEGSAFHSTPNLDQLLASGVRFSQFYSSHPVCSPTRASLMTGKAPHHHRITDWIHPASGIAIQASEVTLAERFRDSGYQTAYLGKWHLGESDADLPTNHGFDWIKGVNRAGQPGSYYYPYQKPLKEPTRKVRKIEKRTIHRTQTKNLVELMNQRLHRGNQEIFRRCPTLKTVRLTTI